MKAIGYTVTFLFYAAIASLWSGYVLSVLWAWFVASQFIGAPSLSIPAAIGLAITVRYLTINHRTDPNDKRPAAEKITEGVVTSFVNPAFALLFGYVVHLFLGA
jgi:hypothetical protein